MELLVSQLKRLHRAGRAFIPEACQWNYDAMWCDARLRLLAFPAEQRQILDWLEIHASGLLNPRAGDFSPPLYRLFGEEAGTYLDRCLKSAEGKHWHNLDDDATEAAKYNQMVRTRT